MPPCQHSVAVLGAGFISEFHIRALKALGHSVVAVCDVDGEKAEGLAKRHAVPNHYDSAEELLQKSSCDIVHIVLPPNGHAPATLQCLRAGRNVFVEKPFATSVQEGMLVEASARSEGRVVGVNHNHCFHPGALQLQEHIRNWRLGAVEHVLTWFNLPLRQLSAGQHGHWMFRRPLNIVLEQAVHPLSQIIQLLGPVRAAEVLGTNEVPLNTGGKFISAWHCALECERGTAQLLLGFGKTYLDLQTHVIGEDGTCTVDLVRNICRVTQQTRFVKPVDDLLAARREGRSIISQGYRNMNRFALAFLKLRPPRDTFFSSIFESTRAFYADLDAGRPVQQGIPEGLAAVTACEMIENARQRAHEWKQERVHG